MPRTATVSLSIPQLEQILRQRKSEEGKLQRRRAKLARQLAKLDSQIQALGGIVGNGRSAGGRVRNAQSLVEMIRSVLTRSTRPMPVADIVAGVQKGGYRSNSANFRGIVNQTLIKEKQFASAGRGVYQLKK